MLFCPLFIFANCSLDAVERNRGIEGVVLANVNKGNKNNYGVKYI